MQQMRGPDKSYVSSRESESSDGVSEERTSPVSNFRQSFLCPPVRQSGVGEDTYRTVVRMTSWAAAFGPAGRSDLQYYNSLLTCGALVCSCLNLPQQNPDEIAPYVKSWETYTAEETVFRTGIPADSPTVTRGGQKKRAFLPIHNERAADGVQAAPRGGVGDSRLGRSRNSWRTNLPDWLF